jgi:hypothetical protein
MATVNDYIDFCLAECYVLQQQIEEDVMTEYHQDVADQLHYEDDYYE